MKKLSSSFIRDSIVLWSGFIVVIATGGFLTSVSTIVEWKIFRVAAIICFLLFALINLCAVKEDIRYQKFLAEFVEEEGEAA